MFTLKMMKQIYQITLFIFSLVLLFSCNVPTTQQENKQSPAETIGQTENQSIEKLDALNRKIRSDSLNPNLFEARAKLYLKNKALTEALKDMYSVMELDSTYSGYYVTLSDVYLAMGKLKKSVENLDKAIELDSKNDEAWLKLAEMSLAIRDYQKALGNIDHALHIDEINPKGYFLRGLVMLETGDTIKGIRNFQKAIDVDQDYFDAHMQLGILYSEKGNDLAIDYFNNALNIKPDDLDVMYYLATYYQSKKTFDKALSTYAAILEINPEYFLATYNSGYINLVYLQDYQQAIDFFTRTIEINPNYFEAYYNRGFSYELLKDAHHAKQDYEKTLELHPNYEKAIDGLNRIEEFSSR